MLKSKFVSVALAISILICGISIGYYFLIALPNHNQLIIDTQVSVANKMKSSEVKVDEVLPKKVTAEKINTENDIVTGTEDAYERPNSSFKAHIIQFGGIHSKIYDGVYWKISSLAEPYPAMDESIQDLPKGLLDISYTGKKYGFNISCPKGFEIMDCSINETKVESFENSCMFQFPDTGKNSDISLICSNKLFEAPL